MWYKDREKETEKERICRKLKKTKKMKTTARKKERENELLI